MSRPKSIIRPVVVAVFMAAALYGIGYLALGSWMPSFSLPTFQSKPARPAPWDQDVTRWSENETPEPLEKRTWLLPRDTPLEEDYVLILTDALTGQGDMVISDQAALNAAKGKAYVEHRQMGVGNSIFAAVITLGQGLAKVSTLAHYGHGGWISHSLSCWYCAHDDASALPRDISSLLPYAAPVERVVITYETRDAYDAAFRPLRAKDGVWIAMAGSYWSDGVDDKPASGRIVTWQRKPL